MPAQMVRRRDKQVEPQLRHMPAGFMKVARRWAAFSFAELRAQGAVDETGDCAQWLCVL